MRNEDTLESLEMAGNKQIVTKSSFFALQFVLSSQIDDRMIEKSIEPNFNFMRENNLNKRAQKKANACNQNQLIIDFR